MSHEPDARSIGPDIALILGSLVGIAAFVLVLLLLPPSVPVGVPIAGMLVVGLVGAVGVVIGVERLDGSLLARKRRYWTRFSGHNELVYEERGVDGAIRSVRFPYERVPLKCGIATVSGLEVTIPRDWDEFSPEWARGRRADIEGRIVDSFGGGTQFRFRSAAEQADAADEVRVG